MKRMLMSILTIGVIVSPLMTTDRRNNGSGCKCMSEERPSAANRIDRRCQALITWQPGGGLIIGDENNIFLSAKELMEKSRKKEYDRFS